MGYWYKLQVGMSGRVSVSVSGRFESVEVGVNGTLV